MKKRVDARVKQQALQTLVDVTPLEVPKSLVELESRQLVERAAADLQSRGLKIEKLPFDPAAFETSAKRRVTLGLIIAELARAEGVITSYSIHYTKLYEGRAIPARRARSTSASCPQ